MTEKKARRGAPVTLLEDVLLEDGAHHGETLTKGTVLYLVEGLDPKPDDPDCFVSTRDPEDWICFQKAVLDFGKADPVEGQLRTERNAAAVKTGHPLHHLYASNTGKHGRSFELGGWRWRPDGSSKVDPQEIARRAVLTWNMAEGIPLEALEAGVVGRFYAAAERLVEMLEKGDYSELSQLLAQAARVRQALTDHQSDLAPDAPKADVGYITKETEPIPP